MLSPKGKFSWTGLPMLCQVKLYVINKGEIQLEEPGFDALNES